MEVFTEYRAEIFAAFWTTIQLTVLSAVGALVLGTVLAAMRLAPVPVLNWLGAAYVNIVRNTPLTLIILFCSFGLAQTLGLTLANRQSPTFIADSGFRLAVLGLTVYTASFVCETVRSGVNTIPLGQAEAARSLGLTFGQNLRIVLLPQAFRAVIIPLGSVLIALTKNTTVAAAASVAEASGLMKRMIEFSPDVMVAIFLTFAIGFCLIVIPIGLLTTWASDKWAVSRCAPRPPSSTPTTPTPTWCGSCGTRSTSTASTAEPYSSPGPGLATSSAPSPRTCWQPLT